MAATLALLSAGAAKGLVGAAAPAFEAASGARVEGTFGAVGAMRERLDAGAPCDAIVLTQAMLEGLARDGRVHGDTILPLGRVATGVAVPAGRRHPRIDSADALREAFATASPIFFPDPDRATAGIHFMKVLRALGLAEGRAAALQPFPNGATAMAALARSDAATAIGCTQVTEILYTPGVELVGPLPPGFELATVYAIAVAASAREPELARRFVAHLAGEATRAMRERGGFEPVAR